MVTHQLPVRASHCQWGGYTNQNVCKTIDPTLRLFQGTSKGTSLLTELQKIAQWLAIIHKGMMGFCNQRQKHLDPLYVPLTLFHMIGVFKDPRRTNQLIIFNRFYIDANMFRNLHQHAGCSEKYSFCHMPPCMQIASPITIVGCVKNPKRTTWKKHMIALKSGNLLIFFNNVH